MSDFSIEMAAEKIVDERTKRYFEEVKGSYYAGHYRSAVVMLWSVVVCDIVFKLDQLANAYSDTNAFSILQEIKTYQKNHPISPEWESKLLELMASKTDLIDQAELTHLKSLQQHRHLSAHPVLDQSDALYSPNKETTRAHIRNALEATLIKPAIMSKKVFDAFVEDIESYKSINPENSDREKLKKYLETKFFKHFSKTTELAIFRNLWRLVFKSQDPRCERNQEINSVVLSIIMERKPVELLSEIEKDSAWYSDISHNEKQLTAVVDFLCEQPSIYNPLTNTAKTPIENYASRDLDHYSRCWFISDTPAIHCREVLRRISEDKQSLHVDAYQRLNTSLKTADIELLLIKIGIHLYGESPDFNLADNRFLKIIKPHMSNFTECDFIELLTKIENNNQTWGRGRAKKDHNEIKDAIIKKYKNFNFSDYPNYQSSLGES